jgi:hypothetical protein
MNATEKVMAVEASSKRESEELEERLREAWGQVTMLWVAMPVLHLLGIPQPNRQCACGARIGKCAPAVLRQRPGAQLVQVVGTKVGGLRDDVNVGLADVQKSIEVTQVVPPCTQSHGPCAGM